MSKETQIGNLVIDLKIKTESLEKGLETAKKKLQEIENQNKQVEKSNKGLDASFVAMAVGIVASLSKIKSAIDSGVDAYKEYESASKGLESIVKGQGLSFNNAQSFIEDYVSDGLIPLADATLAYKNLAARGYNQEQIEKTMIALKDAAAFGRQSTYEYGQAIATATEGLKNENSILVDNAGVTKNVAKMWQDYAKSVGKTTEQLTQAEKIQAEVNGISEESKNQIGDAAKYAETYAGQQAKLNASMIELKKTFGEAIIPALQQLNSFLTPIIQGISSFIQNNQALTSGITTFAVSLGSASVAMLALKKAHDMYKESTIMSTIATKGFTAALKENPIFFIATTIITVVSAFASYNASIKEQEELQKKVNESTERYNKIKQGTLEYTLENTEAIKSELNELDKLKKKIEENGNAIEDVDWSAMISSFGDNSAIKERIEMLRKYGGTIEEINEQIKERTDYLEEAAASEKIKDAMDLESIKTQQKEAAQLKINANEMQDYLNIVKKGDKSTSEYSNAVKKLAEAYPEAANAEGIIIDQAQDYINAEQGKADQSWNTVNEIIRGNSEVINKYIEMAKEAENNVDKQKQLANEIGLAYDDIIPTLTSVLNILGAIGNQNPEDVPGTHSSYSSYTPRRSSGASKSYSNKALDNYKEYIEYKKSLDQISLQEEINMYKTALNSYAKTTSEKRDLTVKIYELEKELREKTLSDYTDEIEYKKSMGKLSLQEEINMYKTALNEYAKTQEEKRNIRIKIHDLEKELKQEEKELNQNELNKYLSNIEYKKSMDKLSLQEEINMYKKALNEYAKTSEDKRNLRIKIYELEKELGNKELDDFKNEIQYKKSMEKISLQDELEMYRNALVTYAKTAEQRREIRIKIYELEKELNQQETNNLKNSLDEQVKDVEESMEEKEKLQGASYTIINRKKDYDNLIKIHKKYLDEILKSEELSLEEKKKIYEQELEIIKGIEEKKRDERVKGIDNTVTQLTNAIKKQLQEAEDADKKAIEKNIEIVEKWKTARIDAINEEYNTRIEAIQKELDLLDKSEQDKTRAEEDAEYERKKNRLQQLIAYEHDVTTKANYQKELDKLTADYQKTIDKRTLDDKKAALKEQQDILKEKQSTEVEAVEKAAEEQKEQLDKQLNDIDKFYKEQQDKAQETAEKMLLNADKYQKDIIKLLKKYGNEYEITGQSLGEKLAQGLNDGATNEIEKVIKNIQKKFDKAIENKISSWITGIDNTTKTTKNTGKNIIVNQNNYIQNTPDTPSETWRKLKGIEQKLASQLAGA